MMFGEGFRAWWFVMIRREFTDDIDSKHAVLVKMIGWFMMVHDVF